MKIGITKGRFAPIIERYVNRVWESVNNSPPRRCTIADMNCKHNREYKVAYCSDPLLVIHGEYETEFNELENKLQEQDLWSKNFIKIQIAKTSSNGEPGYMNAYRTPSDKDYITLFESFKNIIEKKDEQAILSNDNVVGLI